MRKKMRKKEFFLLLVLFIVTTITVDQIRISRYKIIPAKPLERVGSHINGIYAELCKGSQEVDWSGIEEDLHFISNEYDCSDFRLVNLVRVLYKFEDKIPEKMLSNIEKTLFNFRYWWDEPGKNSMCYWSENHQILFASAEYLIGKKYPDTQFKSGLTGKEHMEKARIRIIDWLEMRWKYGFIEFYSEVYYKEDIGGLINLIDFANDNEIEIKAKIVMDLLFYDVACQSLKTTFSSSSGRAYFRNRKGINTRFSNLTNYYWGNGEESERNLTYGMVTTQAYTLPPVLAEIAKDTSDVVIKQCNGLDISELKGEGYYGTDNRSMMMQWGMECFSNPEIIRNSLYHLRHNISFENAFTHSFKIMDYSLLRWLGLEPFISRIIKPQSDGVAIQKGETYTYRTKDYLLFAVQNYHPGTYGDQHHVAGIHLNGSFSLFHNHPAAPEHMDTPSPSYWVGYGHLPHVAQDQNVNLAIYHIPEKKGVMEKALLGYTHAFYPKEMFDQVIHDGAYIFGKKGNAYCALIGKNPLYFNTNSKDDLIQDGRRTFWIIEAGSKQKDHSFEAFCKRVKGNSIKFDSSTLSLSYHSNGNRYDLAFKKEFKLNGNVVNTNYKRFDSPYSQTEKKPNEIYIECNEKTLYLDFYNLKRDFDAL